jgi:thiol-disulfide isomerase/thioredoxin
MNRFPLLFVVGSLLSAVVSCSKPKEVIHTVNPSAAAKQSVAPEIAAPPPPEPSEPAATDRQPAKSPLPPSPANTIATSGPLAAQDFTNLQLPANADAKTTLEFLGSIDKTLQKLLVTASAGRITKDQAMQQAAKLGDLKLDAADHLAQVATAPMHHELAALAKMEALSHHASLGDGKAANELRSLASNADNFQSELVSHQAAIVLLGLELSDLAAGIKEAQPVLKQLDIVLAKPSNLKLPDFHASAQVVQVLDQHNMTDAAALAKSKVVAAFANHPDPQIGIKTWFLQVGNSQEYAAFKNGLNASDVSLPDFQASISGLLKAGAPQWTLSLLMQNLIEVEYSGQLDKAGVMASTIQDNLASIAIPELLKNAQQVLGGYQKRIGAIGQAFSMEGLSVTQDGQPVATDALAGKVVLVDFWASWCQPCRIEFPNLREQYAKYRAQGFEIVGINLDKKYEDMEAFLQKEALPWIHAYSSDPSQTEFNTRQAVDYGVAAIPFMMLIGRDGKVIAIHTKGEALNRKLAELFP